MNKPFPSNAILMSNEIQHSDHERQGLGDVLDSEKRYVVKPHVYCALKLKGLEI